MADYCAEADVKQIFGDDHVDDWATMDPADNAATIAARIARMCKVASGMFDDVLRATNTGVPLQNADGTYPVTAVDLSARLTGLLLYEANGTDQPAQHRYSFMREDVFHRLEQIRLGQIKLDAEIGG
jgi:hypothetical protein